MTKQSKKLQFFTDSYKFPTEDIIVAQNFNFGFIFFFKWRGLVPNVAFLDGNFSTRRRFFDTFPIAQI